MSPNVDFDTDALKRTAAAIYEQIDGKEFVAKLAQLRQGFDWNPFDEDGDEYVGLWAEVHQNFKLLGDLAMAAVYCAERATIAGKSLSDPQKHAACVQVLDDIVRLPWYLEPFDGIAFDMAVSAAVAGFNAISWLKDGTDATVNKIDLTLAVMAATPERIDSAKERIVEKYRPFPSDSGVLDV